MATSGLPPRLDRTLSRNSAARTASPLYELLSRVVSPLNQCGLRHVSRSEPQCLEFRERNEARKKKLCPFVNPLTPEQHQMVSRTQQAPAGAPR